MIQKEDINLKLDFEKWADLYREKEYSMQPGNMSLEGDIS